MLETPTHPFLGARALCVVCSCWRRHCRWPTRPSHRQLVSSKVCWISCLWAVKYVRSTIGSLAGYLMPINRPLSTVIPLGRRTNDEFQHSYGNKMKVATHQSSRAKTTVRCMDWATLLQINSYPFLCGIVCWPRVIKLTRENGGCFVNIPTVCESL